MENVNLITPEVEIQKLPPYFQHGLTITDSAISADMLLIALLTATSSVLPRFYFLHGYPEHRYGANLMSLVIAPPASGKGIMNRANQLVDWADHTIPGNSSLSAFLSEMERLNGYAYMMETEADVMSKTLRVSGNDYSYILRQAWEGETIRRARNGNNKQRIVINNPHLSLLLSGTFNQLQPLLRSQANGLTSRMMCYLVTQIQGFDSRVFGQDILEEKRPADEVYADLTNYLHGLYDWQIASEHDCRFCLTEEQAQRLTEWFSNQYSLMMDTMEMPLGFDSALKRLAVTIMRIGMILNAVRLNTSVAFPQQITCHEDDFDTMLLMAERLTMHMVDIFDILPEDEMPIATEIITIDRHEEALHARMELLKKLPQEFTTRDIRIAAEQENITSKTAERWTTMWCKERQIERICQGHYRKTIREGMSE